MDFLEESRLFGRSNSKNAISMLDQITQNLEGDYADELANAAEAARGNLASNVSPSLAAGMIRPILKQLCKSVITRGDTSSDASMLAEWYRYNRENGQRVLSRRITYGTPTADGSNIGNGQIIRLTKDGYNFDIESTFIESKRAICIADYQTGTQRGAEAFLLSGQTPARDDLERSGSNAQAILTARTADDSLIFNASFGNITTSSGAPTDITNWTSNITVNSTNYSVDTTNYFRAAPSESTPQALNIKASAMLTQKLSLRGTKLREDRPYILAVAWNRQVGSGSGTLVLRMGNRFNSVSVAAQTGWQITTVPTTTGQSNWYTNFAEDDMDINLQWTRSGGDLLIDDVLFLEGTPFEGCYYWAIPSSGVYVPHRVNDKFTWADSEMGAKIQRWIAWAFASYQPHSLSSAVTISDP